MALSLTPLEDYAQVKALMQKTADAYMLSARYTSPALHKLKNCEAALKKAEKGSNLSLRELLDVSAVLHNIRSVTLVRMEVPCCGGLERAVQKALAACGRPIPFESVTLSVRGEIL